MKKRRIHLYLFSLVLLSLLFMSVGFYIFLVTEIPSVKALKDLTNKPVSRIYGINDQVVYMVVPDNKISVPYSKIPKHVREAFLAAEDADFFTHAGVQFKSIFRALAMNVIHGRVVQGGSTITQQVIKALILGPEKSMMRKVREAILAYRLETYLTKQEILNVYLNNIYMGQGVYGVEAASQVYFGRHVWEISRAEAALLAGIVQAPARYTPKHHPGLARMRQLYVIDQLWKKGFVDGKKKDAMLKERTKLTEDDGIFADTYFKSAVCKYIEDKYGRGIFARRAMKIYATVDPALQRAAENAVRIGLAVYDERQGDYSVSYHLDRRKWEGFTKSAERDLTLTPLIPHLAYSLLVSERVAGGYAVLIGIHKGFMKMSDFPFKPGDVVKGLYDGTDKKKTPLFSPVRSSGIEGALICMDVNTGYLYAVVGGREFERSPYNRALSAKVQPGSAFKPFIYLAALEKGYDVDSIIMDEPKKYGGGGGKTWVPKNYDGTYSGPITLGDALAYSKNAATVRLLEEVGVGCGREGAPGPRHQRGGGRRPVDCPRHVEPHPARSRQGLLGLRERGDAAETGHDKADRGRPGERARRARAGERGRIDGRVAFKMNTLLKGVTTYGTAKAASRLGYPVAGKTGTTNSFYDALFVGYSPHLCAGVWVGFDQRTSLGKAESGGRVALPIWMRFMATALRRFPPDDFAPPAPPESPTPPETPPETPPPSGTL